MAVQANGPQFDWPSLLHVRITSLVRGIQNSISACSAVATLYCALTSLRAHVCQLSVNAVGCGGTGLKFAASVVCAFCYECIVALAKPAVSILK